MSREHAELVLRHMQVPNENGLYILGTFERRVTLRSQQVRALNLVCAFDALGALKETGRIAIVGGGVAGMTAAAGAARLGYEVTLLEKKDSWLPLFRRNTTRWLHPHIYDWPETPGETRHDGGPLDPDEAGLPLLSWRADFAGRVVDQLDAQWNSLPEHSRIKVFRNVESINLGSGKPRSLSWNAPGRKKGTFDAVILAVGFGLEKPFETVPLVSYWDNERWDQPTRTAGAERYLISGCGDGGLIDLLRLKIKDFRHEEVVRRFVNAPGLQALKENLLAIEEEARKKEARGEEPGGYLEEQYEQLNVPDEVDKAFELRTDTEVTLNGRGDSPLTLRASILHRFLTSRLSYRFEAVPYIEGEFTASSKGDGYEVRFKTGGPQFFHHVICRHGPVPGGALGEGFPSLLKNSDALRARNELDQTRKPLWKPGFFDKTDPGSGGGTPPPTDGGIDRDKSAGGTGTEHQPPFIGITVGSLEKGFKGREQTLEELHALLRDPTPVALMSESKGHVFAHGGGGMGKSRLAIEYAYRYRKEYSGGVFFTRMEKRHPKEIWAEFARALYPGRALPQDEEAALVFAQWLENEALGPRLLVLDDVQADSREELAARFMDRVAVRGQHIWPIVYGHVNVLMTTRMRDIPRARGRRVDRLDAESARTLLVERAGRGELSPDEQASALELASKVLGGHPLANSLAGAYIKRVEFSFSEYLRLIQDKGLTDRLEAASREVGEEIRDHERSIAATYELSREQLDSGRDVDALADRLLEIAAFLEPGTPIDRKLLQRLLKAQDQTVDKEQIGFALARLTKDLALLDPGQDGGTRRGDVLIHPLIADYTRWRMDAEKRQELQQALLTGMLGLFPDSADELWKITRSDAHPKWEYLSPAREAHVAAVWTTTRAIESLARTILSWGLGHLYLIRGNLISARDAFSQSLEIAQRLATREPDTALWQRGISVSLNHLGDALRAQGNLDEARRTFSQSLEIAQRLAAQEPDNAQWQRDVSVSLNHLGDVLRAQGNLEEARSYFSQDLEIAQRLAAREPDNTQWQRDVSVSLDRMGDMLRAQSNLEEAHHSFSQSLEIRQRLAEQEPDNAQWQRDVSVSLNKLGDILSAQGNLEEARHSFSQSLEIRQRLAGWEPDNAQWQTDVVAAQIRVAHILMQGISTERTEAIKLIKQAQDILLRLAASSRLTHAQQHQWLPAIEAVLQKLNEVETEEA